MPLGHFVFPWGALPLSEDSWAEMTVWGGKDASGVVPPEGRGKLVREAIGHNTPRCASEPPSPCAGPETPRRHVCLKGVGDVGSSFSIIPIRLHKKKTVSFYFFLKNLFFIEV